MTSNVAELLSTTHIEITWRKIEWKKSWFCKTLQITVIYFTTKYRSTADTEFWTPRTTTRQQKEAPLRNTTSLNKSNGFRNPMTEGKKYWIEHKGKSKGITSTWNKITNSIKQNTSCKITASYLDNKLLILYAKKCQYPPLKGRSLDPISNQMHLHCSTLVT